MMVKTVKDIDPVSTLQTMSQNSTSNTVSKAEDARPTSEHIDAISLLFSELEMAYHNQFHKAYPDNTSLSMAKQLWLKLLAGYPAKTIVLAGRKALGSSDYLPTLNAIKQCCEDMIMSGVPNVKLAYLEACRATEPKRDYVWSHPIVYLAGQASDWFFLASQTEAQTFPVFERNYQILCERIKNGEELKLPIAKALEKEIHRPLDKATQKEKLAAIKKELEL